MTNEEKAYIAGIIDGEGSIMLQKFHYNQYPAPCITIASVSIELLEWIKNTVKVGTIKSKKNYKPEKHLDSYTYVIKHNDAIDLLTDIHKYLVIDKKRKRAQMIVNEYKSITLRNGRYSYDQLKLKNEFYERFMNL